MGVGIFLLMLGAILAFAVRKDTSVVDVQMVGLILLLGGVASILHARSGSTTEKRVTRIDDTSNPHRVVQTVHEAVREQDPNEDYHHPRP